MHTHLLKIGGQGYPYVFPHMLSAFIFPDKISLYFRTQQLSLASWLGKCKDLSVSMPSALELQIHANIPGKVIQAFFFLTWVLGGEIRFFCCYDQYFTNFALYLPL